MSSVGESGTAQQSVVEEIAIRAARESGQLAAAAMALLHCRNSDDVYEVIGDFMGGLVPDAVVIVNEATPELDGFTTQRVTGLDGSSLLRAVDFLGFEIVGKQSAIPPALRDRLLSGTLSKIDGGIVELASLELPSALAQAGARLFGIRDVFTIGIADQDCTLGNFHILTRTPNAVLPTHAIESFAHHCFSALSRIIRERELVETSHRNELLLSSMVEGLALHEIIIDEVGKPCDYRFVGVNRAFETMTGLKARDVVGRTVLEVLPGTEPYWIERYGIVAVTGEATRFEEYSIQFDKHFAVTAYSPQLGQFATVISDITERKRSEEALILSESRFKAIFENAPSGIALIDSVTGRIEDANVMYTRIMGRTLEELRGLDWMSLTHPDDVQASLDEEAILDAGESTGFEAQKRYIRPDGSIVWANLMEARVQIGDEVHPKYVAIVEDITADREVDELLTRQRERLDRTLTSVIDIAGTIGEARDPYTAGHQRRVAEIAVRVAQDLGMSDEEVADIKVAGLLHDVGKVTVPAEILSKPGAISQAEFGIIRAHAEAGHRIVVSAHMEEPIPEMILQHHERLDGSGYPRGLVGEQILLGAMVLAVADVADAMMSHRPYRPALGVDAALAEIERGAGRIYDARVSGALIALFREGRFGSSCCLGSTP